MALAQVACAPPNPVVQVAPLPTPTTPMPGASATGERAPSPIGKTAHVPEATFRMGSELGEPDEMPVRPVHVAGFDMDLTEVTVGQYAGCARAGACQPAPSSVQWPGVTGEDQQISADICNADRPDRQDHAINCVDWTMANAYCAWSNGRLPTEAEWEYAACGGDCSEGMKAREGGRSAIRGAASWPLTSRVARRRPGPFGLYDMAGNVWEWTASPYCPYDHPGCGDPRRVVRGGSWSMVDYVFVRLTDRSPSDPATRNTNLGFRCAHPAALGGGQP
jgi:formylglycine-generating enzyme required for sulfatase activity